MLLQLHFLRWLQFWLLHESMQFFSWHDAWLRMLLLFPLSCVHVQVLREEEFAPVKNANGSNYDTPDSAKMLVFRLHTRWVVAAGGFLTHSVPLYATGMFSLIHISLEKLLFYITIPFLSWYVVASYSGVEVSPLCSYAGENLEPICRGRTFHAPCEISF